MTAAAPWSVKGIDPKAREVAKDLARRSGMTLGEWLNRMIIEGEGGADAATLEAFGDAGRPSNRYFETDRNEAPARIEAPQHPADEVGRVAQALDRLADRIEAAESRSAQAITGIDESVRGVLQRLALAEREQIAVAARFEGVADDIKTDQARAAERLRRIEAEAVGPRSAEALRALEGALGKVAGHLYEGEARTRETLSALEARIDAKAGGDTSTLVEDVVARLGQRLEAAESRTTDALRELGQSFHALDGRLQAVEGGDVQKRLDDLTTSLTQRMEASRLEMAAKLRETADGRFDRVDRKLGEMTAHVQAAEHRSAQALERMGREVVGLADAFNRRIQTSEARSANAIEQVGGEVARIASAVEHKLSRADSVHAQALEKLGSEIARITEKLAERIGNAERRNALAIDDVGEQVTRVADRLNQRHERTSQALIDRIRQSEARTARMLDEAREKIDSRLGDAQRKLIETPAPVAAAPVYVAPAPSPFDGDRFSFGGEAVPEDVFNQAAPFVPATPARTAPPVFESASFGAAVFPSAEPDPPAFAADDYAAADGFDGGFADLTDEGAAEASEAATFEIAPEPLVSGRPLSTREVIEQARAAARSAAAVESKSKSKPAKPKPTSLFAGFGQKKAKRGSNTLKTALMVSGTAAVFGVSVAGLVIASSGDGKVSDRVAYAMAMSKPVQEIRSAEADTTPAPPTPRVAVALNAGTTPAAAVPVEATSPAPTENAQALYEEGVRRIEAKDRTGLEPLRKAANIGLPRAQFYLAKLYEVGEGGVKKDLVEARRWTERAATAGDASAMHNLALYYFKGEGGAKNVTNAAQWFRKAADLGLVDSQFNLGQLYEFGRGVDQNPAEAYKWYLIAAKAGDTSARGRAAALRADIKPEALRIAERSAASFRSQTAAAPAPTMVAAAPSANLVTAQKALSRLGYYQGPQDGVASPALRLAIAAYQRDQSLSTTGALDSQTLSRLSAFQ